MPQAGWKTSVTLAAIIERDGRYLLVEEHTPDGLMLNNPAGHLDPGESPIEGVIRETLEESGRRFTPEALVGVYLSRAQRSEPPSDVTFLRLAFSGTVSEPLPGSALDRDRARCSSPEELRACRERHRGPLLMRCVDDHRRPALSVDLVFSDQASIAAAGRLEPPSAAMLRDAIDEGAVMPARSRRGAFPVHVVPGRDYFGASAATARVSRFATARWGRPYHRSSTPPPEPPVYFCGCKQTGHQPFCDGTHTTV
jgi:8-oxo-dGTP pyrophosphatase MutT (NUDIX family)